MANIKNELNNIKSALYGKDVRGSIHDGIDAINKEVESTTGRQVDLENTFDQLVINAGNSNAEIVDARVKNDGTSYSKLGDRLNEVDSQLAHIENEIYFNLKPSLTSKQKTSGLTNIFIGLDSLSNYKFWVKGFIERAKAELGNGGLGYVGLQNNTIDDLGLSWNHNVFSIENMTAGEYPLKYSLDNKGIIVENGDGTKYCNLYFEKNWTYGKVMYLKQPNGGTFDCKWIQDLSSNVTINTNSTSYDLGVYELPGQNTSTRKGWISLHNIIGNVVIFGVFLYNDEGLIYSRIGKGGDKLYNHSLFDETIRDKWIKELNPDLFILNAGTNDSTTLSADEYYTTLNNYTKPFLENDTQFLCVRQNPIYGNAKIDEYEIKLRQFCKENKLSFTSLKDILGNTYEEASKNGYIDDGVHPNEEGNKRITNHFLNLFSIPLIGKIDDNSPKFSDSTSSNDVIPKTILTPKHIAVPYGSSSILYKLGLINGYPNGLLKLTITGNREGSNHEVRKNVYMVINNGTTWNNANFDGLTITTEYEFHTSPNPAVDFNLNVERVDNQVQISISPNTDTVNMRFYVEGEVVLPYNTSKGQAVIEN